MVPGEVRFFVLLIPLVSIVLSTIAAVIIIWVAINYAQKKRELLSRERLAAIEKGLDVPVLDTPTPRHRRSPLHSALILITIGLGLAGASVLQRDEVQSLLMGVSIVLAFVGVGQLAYWFLGGRAEWQRQAALDEELRRAYVARLQGRSSESRSTDTSAA